jgi:hypothetical protein
MTRNHGYKTPSAGAADWHIPLNENFRKIDVGVEIRAPDDQRSDYTPQEGAKFLATDTGQVYLGDGSDWQPLDSTGPNPSLGTVEATAVAGEVYVRNVGGEDLSGRVRTALDSLPEGRGRVRITPRADGQPWQWDHQLELDPTEYGGVHIDIDDTVLIESDVDDGYTIVCDGNMQYGPRGGESHDGFDHGENFRLDGGIWVNVASNPEGAFLVRDMQKSEWAPQMVRDYTNASGDATLWTLQNKSGYCELNRLRRCNAKHFDRAIDLQPASVVSDSTSDATDSFHSTYVGPSTFSGATDFGIRLRGNTANTHLNQTTVFTATDGVVGYVFDGHHKSTTLTSPKIEDVDDTDSDTVGFKTGSEYHQEQAPLVLQPEVNNIDTNREYDADSHAFGVVRTANGSGSFRFNFGPYISNTPSIGSEGEVRSLGYINDDLQVSGGKRSKLDGGFGSDNPQNLSERSGRFVNEIQAHDGSGGGPAGHYEWDGETWHGIGRASGNTI